METEILQIQKMTLEDLPQVLELEKLCFQSLAWDEACFDYELSSNPFGHYFVGKLGLDIICYLGLHMIFEDAHVTTFGTHPNFRNQGYGHQLFRYGLSYAKENGVERMSLEVRVSNEPAKKLYAFFGFQEGPLRKNYYTDNQEDARLMWVKI